MNKSESIKELATALCELQGVLHDTKKDTQAFNYKYSDLSQILTYIRPLMLSNGLSVTQLVIGQETKKIGVETVLMHKSGEWISASSYMDVSGKIPAQEAGKVITYLRRYSLAAIIGLTQTDSDAAQVASDNERIAGEIAIEAAAINKCKSMGELGKLWETVRHKTAIEAYKDTMKIKLNDGK